MRLIDRFRPEAAVRGVPVNLHTTWTRDNTEENLNDFKDYVERAYRQNGIVFGLIAANASIMSEVEFKFQNFDTGNLFGTPELAVLEEPWPNASQQDLLMRLEQDAALAGNAYLYRPTPSLIQRLRPDWVRIVAANGQYPDGYIYGEPGSDQKMYLDAEEVAHFMHKPDPLAAWRGMSWLQPVAREILGDKEMERHKRKFFENAATPNLVLKYAEQLSSDQAEKLRQTLERRYESVENAYRTLVVDSGADAMVVGANMEQIAFTDVQGSGEVRICMAAETPPILVGVTKGLQSATYSNYGQAFRRWIDLTIRPKWHKAASAVGSIVTIPPGARLWYDDTKVAALQQDAQDAAEIRRRDAETLATLVRTGFEPESAIAAVKAGDLDLLVHSGGIPVTLYQDGKDPSMSGVSE